MVLLVGGARRFVTGAKFRIIFCCQGLNVENRFCLQLSRGKHNVQKELLEVEYCTTNCVWSQKQTPQTKLFLVQKVLL